MANIKTIIYDADQWQLAPKNSTETMLDASNSGWPAWRQELYQNMLAVAPQPPVVEIDERAEFEKWAEIKGFCLSRSTIELTDYAEPYTSDAWASWQARAALWV